MTTAEISLLLSTPTIAPADRLTGILPLVGATQSSSAQRRGAGPSYTNGQNSPSSRVSGLSPGKNDRLCYAPVSAGRVSPFMLYYTGMEFAGQ